MPTTTVDDRVVAYLDEGDGSVPPLVCVHGFTGAKEDFAPVVPALAADRRVLALDLPGHGGSQGSDDPAVYTLGRLADWVRRALDVLGLGEVHLLGHSMGGLVAQRVALVASQRLRTLVLSGTGLGAPREEATAAAARIAVVARDAGLDAAFEESRRIATAYGVDVDPLPARDAREAYVRARYRRLRPAAVVGGARALGTAEPLGMFLRGIDVPVLVVHGEHDHIWPASTQAHLAAVVAGARRVAITGGGHSPQHDDPGAYAGAIRTFLADADG